MSDKDSKTEDATPKRLRDAREKGQVPKSQDLNGAASLLVFTLLLGSIGNFLLKNSLNTMKVMLSTPFTGNLTGDAVKILLINGLIRYFWSFLPIALIAMVVGIIMNIVQTGLLFTTTPLKPDFTKLNPIQGFKNLFSKKAMFTLLKNLLKLLIVFSMSYNNISDRLNILLNSGNIGTVKLFSFFINFIVEIIKNIMIVMFIFGVADYLMEKKEHKDNLKMTKEEVKEEYKEMEGSQEVKQAIKQKQREIAMNSMMKDVESATAIITNPTHIAIAIRYDTYQDAVPLVVGKGAGFLAERIKEKAREKDIPIIENKPLARTIYKEVEIGEIIPEKLYKAVAEILALVYDLDKKKNVKRSRRDRK